MINTDFEATSRREAEWEAIQSMYTPDEIWLAKSGDGVCRRFRLPVDQEGSHHVAVNLEILIPNGYPTEPNSILRVEASLTPEQDGGLSTTQAQKVVINSLPRLLANCRWKAKANSGREAMLAILTCAETWVQNDWQDICRKEIQSDNTKSTTTGSSSKKKSNSNRKSLVMGRYLLESHHITDPSKVRLVKSLASQYNLGCCIKSGCPGLVLLEGLEDNCKLCASELIKNRVKQRAKSQAKHGTDTATFALRGSITCDIDSAFDLDAQRLLKTSYEELDKTQTQKFTTRSRELGLEEFLPQVV